LRWFLQTNPLPTNQLASKLVFHSFPQKP